MHYLITGHTGFKGAWLALLLSQRGHEVSGISLDPLNGSLFELAALSDLFVHDVRCDIRSSLETENNVRDIAPDIVVHLAAQPLVRESYREPRMTYETNVMGTYNVLESVSRTPSVKAFVVVTTDKVYRNIERVTGYGEDDPLGGDDPYSSSKAMADILTQSWVKSFPGVPTAVARAGNVIGGGDATNDRLLPDLMNSFAKHETAVLRFPAAVRPWQHVLDCLDGYVALCEALLAGKGSGQWNFGPGTESFVPVSDVADTAAAYWGGDAGWVADTQTNLHEAGLLVLDSSRSEQQLAWRNRLGFPECVHWTIDWNRMVRSGISPRDASLRQLNDYESLPR